MPSQLIAIFAFGIVFLIALIVLAIKFPHPTPFQFTVFRTVLALAAAGAGAMIPGLLDVKLDSSSGFIITASGALGVFLIVFFFNPVLAGVHPRTDNENRSDYVAPPTNPSLPDGRPIPTENREAFLNVWHTLHSLEKAGQNLWLEVTDPTLSAFADKRIEAEEIVGDNAIFFSVADFANLREILNTADFYLKGKDYLFNIRNGQVFSDRISRLATEGEKNLYVDAEVEAQIQQNKEWLDKYRNLLEKIRTSFHDTVA